ncbi:MULTISPECIES: type III-B CRISPR module RAMP protein Cmr4 [Defluviitalea]|uniref:Type III-B CRISPR module RAMP protein Cmr4 n=2 Tax=Defluviitalea TaxID=1185408 RepID=A0A7C8LE16_9FIRM|nr:type III-B CRISPR module RAMP protein Cmr4 [Defluviitalea raffinosedens]KAE9633437.1 type III-B CRISPR module RAMP protein Cmr4 [Defluviitalea raffinosedens]MBM7687172.1 CRISPR-associated protein Cmr4 [Defluviitalea raffinosedens]
MYTSELYIIRALTNMHVGNGDVNYGIVDKEVQRDVITNYPTIYSSSLKGALREFFESKKEDSVKYIFGDVDNAGTYKFFEGHLLSIPVRSNKKPFFRAVCPQIIQDLITCLSDFDIQLDIVEILKKFADIDVTPDKPVIFEKLEGVKIEDFYGEFEYKQFEKISVIEKLFGENIALLHNDVFSKLIKSLPVIARNCLENGISKNLWYEEIIPRETRFYFIVMRMKDEENLLEPMISENIIQMGANASIGYGYTKIQNVKQIVGE